MIREFITVFSITCLILISVCVPIHIAIKDVEKRHEEEKAKQKSVQYEYTYRTDSGTRIGKFCLDGYKFIATKGPGLFDEEVIKQSFIYKDGVSIPEKCSDKNIKYKDNAPMQNVM